MLTGEENIKLSALVVELRKIEMVPSVLYETRSGLPSPSISATSAS